MQTNKQIFITLDVSMNNVGNGSWLRVISSSSSIVDASLPAPTRSLSCPAGRTWVRRFSFRCWICYSSPNVDRRLVLSGIAYKGMTSQFHRREDGGMHICHSIASHFVAFTRYWCEPTHPYSVPFVFDGACLGVLVFVSLMEMLHIPKYGSTT